MNCIQCTGNYLNLPPTGSCSASCPEGYYTDDSAWQCAQCFQGNSPTYYSCATCSAGGQNDCTSCNSGSFLHPNSGGECLDVCPSGYWGDTATNQCQPCYTSSTGPSYSCATCTAYGADNCRSCNAGYFLYPFSGGECFSSCPNGFYGNTSTNTCQPCNDDNLCMLCPDGSFLQPDSNKSCLATCPSGYWRDATSNKCIACNITCQSKFLISYSPVN